MLILVLDVCVINYATLISRTFPFNYKHFVTNDIPKGEVARLFNLQFYNIVQSFSGGDL